MSGDSSTTPDRLVRQHEYVVDEDAGRFALLGPGVDLRAAPEHTNSVWTTGRYDYSVVKVLGEVGDQVEIELDWPDDDAYRCFPSLGTLGIRMFVDIDGLADVVLEPTRIEFDDHSALLVAPGVRVSVEDGIQQLDSTPWFGWGNGDFSATTSAALPIGKFFRPVRRDSLPKAVAISPEVSVSYDHGRTAWSPVAKVFARSPKDGRVAAVGNECLIVVGVQEPEGFYIHGDRYSRHEPWWIVDAGASLTWPDGSPAGVAYHEHGFLNQPRESGSRLCFTPTNRLGSALDGLKVCAERSAMRESDRWPFEWPIRSAPDADEQPDEPAPTGP